MFCSNCGNQVCNGVKFCPVCGDKIEKPTEKKRDLKKEAALPVEEIKQLKRKFDVKQFVAGLLCGAIFFSVIMAIFLPRGGVASYGDSGNEDTYLAVDAGSDNVSEENVFSFPIEGGGEVTPAEAVLDYMEAMKAGNVDAMLSTFAVETYVDEFDFAAMLDYYHSYQFSYEQQLDTTDEYTKSLNIGKRTSDLYQVLTKQYIYLSNPELSESVVYSVIGFDGIDYACSDDFIAELMNDEWCRDLSTLEVTKVYDVQEIFSLLEFTAEKEEQYNKWRSRSCTKYGCDALTSLMVEFVFNGENYCLMMDVAQYGDRWYNISGGYWSSYFGIPGENGGMIRKKDLWG